MPRLEFLFSAVSQVTKAKGRKYLKKEIHAGIGIFVEDQTEIPINTFDMR